MKDTSLERDTGIGSSERKKKHDERICRQRFLVSVYICSVGLSSIRTYNLVVGDITATIHISTKYFCRARKDMSFLGSTFVVLFDYLLCFGIHYGSNCVETMHIEVLLYYRCIACVVPLIRHRSPVTYKRVLFIPLKVYQDNNIGLKDYRFNFSNKGKVGDATHLQYLESLADYVCEII